MTTLLREPAFEEEGFPDHPEEKDHHGEEHGANKVEHEVVLTPPHSTLPTHKGKASRLLFVSCLNLWMAASFLAACWHHRHSHALKKKLHAATVTLKFGSPVVELDMCQFSDAEGNTRDGFQSVGASAQIHL